MYKLSKQIFAGILMSTFAVVMADDTTVTTANTENNEHAESKPIAGRFIKKAIEERKRHAEQQQSTETDNSHSHEAAANTDEDSSANGDNNAEIAE